MKSYQKRNRKGGANATPTTSIQTNNGSNLDERKNGISPNPGSLASLMVFLGPYMLLAFFFILSVFTLSSKGIVFLVCVTILYAILYFLQKFSVLNNTSPMRVCNFFGMAGIFDLPSFSSALYAFTIMYLLMPMIGKKLQNIAIIVFLAIVLAFDSIIRLNNKCTNLMGIVFGVIIGLVIGNLSVFLVSQMNPDFLFYSEYVSDKLACSIPGTQKFKCKVLSGGVPVAETTI
tara:strand:- start:474 stop:1169 length:696 start_codon:yes stop_codon:yes gene_type:complete